MLDDKELVNDMVQESKEHLAAIEPDLLALEEKGNDTPAELINRLFRAMHSIKGGFSFLGLMKISDLAHSMETVMARVRDGELFVKQEMVDALLEGVDKLGGLIDDANNSESVSIADELVNLKVFHTGGEPEAETSKETKEPEPAPEPDEEAPVKAIVAEPEPVKVKKAKKTKAGQKAPAAKGAAHAKGSESLRVRLDLLNHLMNLAGELVLARNQIITKMNQKAIDLVADENAIEEIENFIIRKTASFTNSIKTHMQTDPKGDHLPNLVKNELVGARNHILNLFSTALIDTPGLKSIIQQVNLITSDLEGSVMRTRLQPVGSVFSKLPRIIRDLSKTLGKQIKLELVGEEVELDKSIVEALSDPLVHLIRNCGDHAIEPPDERGAIGKNPEGTVRVSAIHEGDQVVIEIFDDGRGIDPERTKAKAIEKGILSEEEAETMSDQQAQELIFAAGFSTAQSVTGVSGRGVGMDVVRTNVEKLGGSVEISSTLGSGTAMRLHLPLTMSIIPTLLVRAGKRTFAMPQSTIEDLIRIRASEVANRIEKLRGQPVLRRRGKLLPLVRLADVLEIERIASSPGEEKLFTDKRESLVDRRRQPLASLMEARPQEAPVDEKLEKEIKKRTGDERRTNYLNALHVMVLKVGGHRYGLIVDELLDNEEIVVKPLSAFIKECGHYAGATILGSGTVAMILDPAGIAERIKMSFSAVEQENMAEFEMRKEKQETESQILLLFKNNSKEIFALNVDLISRIVKIPVTDIESVGAREFIKRDGDSMRVIRLHDYLPITRPESATKFVYVIIPKLVRHPIGIIASEPLDIIRSDTKISRGTINGTGIVGSGVIDGKLVIFIDIYSLFETAEPELYKQDTAGSRLKGKRVLLAEDTAFFRTVTTKYLEEMGCEVETAVDGVAAWEKLNSGRSYDILITDINMPHMNGLELTKKIRASAALKSLPIITCTSMEYESDRILGLEAGVDAYELKLDKERLVKTLTKTLSDKGKL